MKLISYDFLKNGFLRLDFPGNQNLWVRLDEQSGRIITRIKINTISRVQHTGIWLGTDMQTQKQLILHNHIDMGSAYISTLEAYAHGQRVYWKNENCRNDRLRVLQIGLNHVMAGKRYHALSYNCQTYTNAACHNSHHSEDVAKWAARIAGGIAAILLAKAIVQV